MNIGEKKLGKWLLVELFNNSITLYKKWSAGESYEQVITVNFKNAVEVFNKINLKNVYEILK